MGYRSEVTILFYSDEKEFPMLKLWVEENLAPTLREHWNGDDYKPDEFERGYVKGYALNFSDVKWYESYEDVQAIERAWELFDTTFGQDNETTLAGERARVGEDYSDVEYGSTWHSQNLLSIVRHSEY